MKIFPLTRPWRHLRRYNQIIRVLLKYGFGEIVEAASGDLITRFGEKIIPRARMPKAIGATSPERLRLAIEELGPTFIKLGQILSLRPDLIPPDYAAELTNLQDNVTPIGFETISKVLTEELPEPGMAIFKNIEQNPLAAASLAQVHRATLQDGTAVVLKVQRPGARAVIEVDLEILRDLAGILRNYILEKFVQDPLELLAEFDKSIHRELDFRQEGRQIDQFRNCFAGEKTIFIPQYYAAYSTARLLVMQMVAGIKASDLAQLQAAGIDCAEVARRGVHLSFRQIFEFGFFHADPHPGNIMILPDNIVAPLDFGMVGQVDELTIDSLGDLLVGILRKDVNRALRALEDLTGAEFLLENQALRVEVTSLINNYTGIPLSELRLNALMQDFFDLVRKFRLRVPSHLAMMLKALVTVEGLARQLYPAFDFFQELQPYILKIVRRRFEPRRMLSAGTLVVDDLLNLVADLPRKMRAIVTKAAAGKFAIQFQHRNLERLIEELKHASNRLSAALIIAALIVGSSLVIQVSGGVRLFGYPIIGIIGYLVASILGIKLIWDMTRKKQR